MGLSSEYCCKWKKEHCLDAFFPPIDLMFQDVKFPLMLDVYELCTSGLQEKMVAVRSKFKEIEDKKLEKQSQKVEIN